MGKKKNKWCDLEQTGEVTTHNITAITDKRVYFYGGSSIVSMTGNIVHGINLRKNK